jgi:flagellar motor component MotA
MEEVHENHFDCYRVWVYRIAMLGGPLGLLADEASAAIVVGITILLTLGQHPMSRIRAAFGAAFVSDAKAEDIPQHTAVLTTIRGVALGSGLVGTLLGLVTMLANMDDPNTIGPAMSVAVLAMFYGAVIAEVIVAPLIGGLTRPQRVDGEGQSLGWPLVGLLGTVGLVLFGILFGGQLTLFVNVPSVCLVFGMGLCLIFGQFSAAEVTNTLGGAFRRRAINAKAAESHAQVLRTMRGVFHAAGAVGFLVGLVIMLANLADPSRIGPAMAISLLSPLYATLVAELLLAPLLASIPARVSDPENFDLEQTQLSLAPGGFFFLGAVAVFFLLLVCFK